MPDYWALLHRWTRERGPDAPLYTLGSDLLFTIPGLGTLNGKLGTVPASPGTASALLDREMPVLVYPGGRCRRLPTLDRTPPGRSPRPDGVRAVGSSPPGPGGAARVARQPRCHHRGGSWRGTRPYLGLDRFRLNVLPLVLGPIGVWLMPIAGPPLPAKVISEMCEPFNWSHLGPDAADDDEVVRHCYEEVLGRMESCLDGSRGRSTRPGAVPYRHRPRTEPGCVAAFGRADRRRRGLMRGGALQTRGAQFGCRPCTCLVTWRPSVPRWDSNPRSSD